MTSTFTTEFGHEYERERSLWLRRRFLWYSGVILGFSALTLIIGIIGVVVLLAAGPERVTELPGIRIGGIVFTFDGEMPDTQPELEPDPVPIPEDTQEQTAGQDDAEAADANVISRVDAHRAILTGSVTAVIAILLSGLLYLAAFVRVRRKAMEREALLSLVSRLIILSGMIGILNSVMGHELLQWTSPEVYRRIDAGVTAELIGFQSLFGVMVTHFIASLFLPWTAKESLRPIVPLAVVAFAVTAFYSLDRPWFIVLAIVLMFLAAVPGLLVCWLRASRFRSKFHFKMVTRRYGEMKNELDAARQIHDAMFPAQVEDGPVHMRYSYEPMRQIGGDYLFAHRVPSKGGADRGLLVVLIDVTGHGISAALTVNRLQGEIERQVSKDPSVSPGTVLSELNDYLHHTLAVHSVYATAMVMRFDPDAETVIWASAGHPPGFLCTADKRIHQLESTTIVLGATRGEHFQAVEERLPFLSGDTVLAYTDGAIEAKNAQGRMLRIEGVERFLAGHMKDYACDGGIAKAMLQYVDSYRFGPAQDDSLIVEICRPM